MEEKPDRKTILSVAVILALPVLVLVVMTRDPLILIVFPVLALFSLPDLLFFGAAAYWEENRTIACALLILALVAFFLIWG